MLPRRHPFVTTEYPTWNAAADDLSDDLSHAHPSLSRISRGVYGVGVEDVEHVLSPNQMETPDFLSI